MMVKEAGHQLLAKRKDEFLILSSADFLLTIQCVPLTLLNLMMTTGANVDVQFKTVDSTPGLTVRTRSTRSWTPIATRTKARMKK